MFSATFASDVEEWCKLHLDNVVQVYVGARYVILYNVMAVMYAGPWLVQPLPVILKNGVNFTLTMSYKSM